MVLFIIATLAKIKIKKHGDARMKTLMQKCGLIAFAINMMKHAKSAMGVV
jgi:hypothetical protein